MAENSISGQCKLIMIGGSAGSLEVLLEVLPGIDPALNIPIVIVLHRKNTSDSVLTNLLGLRANIKVKEAEEKEMIAPGHIYIAPADYHLLIEKDGTFSLDDSEKVNYCRPSIDITFECAAEAYGSAAACILLSGANADGAEGMKAMQEEKGITAVQDPADAEVPYMPQQALRYAGKDNVLKNERIAAFINELAG